MHNMYKCSLIFEIMHFLVLPRIPDWFSSKISPHLFVCTLCIHEHLMQTHCKTVPHIHLVATERSNQPECTKNKMGASCSSSPFVTFGGRTCSYSLSFSIEDHHWFCSNGFTRGSIQCRLLLSFCRFELHGLIPRKRLFGQVHRWQAPVQKDVKA